MPTIHQSKMISGIHNLTGQQQAEVASLLRANDCPYLLMSDSQTDEAAPTIIVVMQTWAPIMGQVLSKVLDPDKPVPPANVAALLPMQADNGEVVPSVTLPDPVGDVAAAA